MRFASFTSAPLLFLSLSLSLLASSGLGREMILVARTVSSSTSSTIIVVSRSVSTSTMHRHTSTATQHAAAAASSSAFPARQTLLASMSTTNRPVHRTVQPIRPTTTSSSVAASLPSGQPGSLQFRALKAHNDFRALHGAAPLSWNTTLTAAAQGWANKCVFKHSGGTLGPWGENLAAMSGTSNTIADGIKLWTDEAPDYTPSNPNYSHFTQVVWKATTFLGCAVATCAAGTIFPAQYGTAQYYVCEYNPPGNVYPAANFQKNVQP